MSDARIAETWLIMLLARVYTREESAARRAVAALQLEINIDDVRFKQSTITITERSANARFPKCHAMNVLSFFASTYFLGDSGASLNTLSATVTATAGRLPSSEVIPGRYNPAQTWCRLGRIQEMSSRPLWPRWKHFRMFSYERKKAVSKCGAGCEMSFATQF